jgi:Annexin
VLLPPQKLPAPQPKRERAPPPTPEPIVMPSLVVTANAPRRALAAQVAAANGNAAAGRAVLADVEPEDAFFGALDTAPLPVPPAPVPVETAPPAGPTAVPEPAPPTPAAEPAAAEGTREETAPGGAAPSPKVPGATAAAVATEAGEPPDAFFGPADPPLPVSTPDELASAVGRAAGKLPEPGFKGSPERALDPVVGAAQATGGAMRASVTASWVPQRVPPPRLPNPIEIDPVPKATDTVVAAVNARLPEVTMPKPWSPPNGPTAVVKPLAGVTQEEVQTEEPPPPPEKPKELARRAKDQRDAAKKKAEETPVPVETPKPIPIDPPVLADWRPPPTPPPTKAEKTDVTAALAQVLADPTAEAKAIVATARQHPVMFRGTLETVELFKTIGDKDLVPHVETSLKAKMDELKKAVGIADEELTKAIEARKQLLADRAAGRQTDTQKVVDAKAEALKKEAEKTKGEADAKARREEVKRIRRLQAAQWSHDPKLIDELVEHRFGIIDADVGRAVVAHKKAAERRRALLDRFETGYKDAAREADDRAQMVKTADGKETPIPPQFRRAPTINATQGAPGEPWLPWAEKEIRKAFDALRADTDKARDALIADVEKAGLDARTAVREWAAKRLHKERTADKVQSDLAEDKARQQKGDEDMAKEAVQTDARDRLVTDVRAATQLHAILNDKDVQAGKAEDAELRKKQKEIAEQYLAAGNDPADPLSTVAAHLRGEFRMAQLLGEKDDGLLQKLRKQVLDTPIPSDVRGQQQLGKVLFSENPPDAYQRAQKAFEAMDIVGTEEKDVYRALAGLTPTQAQLVRLAYTDKHHRDLESHIRSEFSGAEKRRALALLNAQPVEAAVAAIEYAKPLLGGPASKEDRADIIEAIRQLPPGKGAELSAAYEKQTDGDKLDDVLTETMRDFRADPNGGGFKPDDRGSEEAKLLIQLNVAQAPKKVDGKEVPPNQEEIDRLQAQVDALAFDRGLRTYGFGKPKAEADFAMVRGELERIRREVEQAHPEWTQDQVDAATRRRMAAMEYQFERRVGPEVSGGAKYGGTMQKLLSEQLMGGPKLDLTRAQLYVDRRAEIAARLELEATDGAYSTDDVLNANLQLNWDMAADRVKRSPDTQKLRDDLRTRMDADTRAGRAWDQTKIEAEERALDRQIEANIKTEAITGMGEVKGRFGSMYGEKWGGAEGALKRMLESETQGTGQWWVPGRASEQEAMWRLEQGGGLNRGQKILLGVHGYDMEREEVLGGLEGRTAEEIKEINDEFAAAAERLEGKREDMFKRLRSESSGRNRFDIDEALRGIPITPEDRLAAMQRRIEWEKTAYFSGNATLRDHAAEAELAYMQREYDYAKERYNKFLDAKTKNLPVAERNALQVAFTEQSQVALAAADAYRKRVDSYVDTFVQIAAAAAAITAAIIVSVATGFTATPAMVALVASLWGTAATVAAKAYLLDKAYGIHELKGDLIVGGVDAVFAVATAGLGDKLLGIAKATGATQVALKEAIKRAAIQRAAKPLIARIGAEIVEQIAQAAPGALVGQALNRQSWRGDPFKNITTGALTQVGMGMGIGFTVGKVLHVGGMVVGAALERLKGLKANVFLPAAEAALHDPAALPRDSLLNRGTPTERMAAFREFKEKYPLATLSDFNEAVKRGQAILEAAAEEVREMRRAMRTEVLADIPPRERARFAGTPIEVLSDAEFTARTGSQQKGIAAVLIVDGKPTIVVREGAGGTALAMALREEGLHLRQVADPENATRIARLDESRLARWPDLPLEERMASWRAKLELEIDAQLQRIKRLEAQLSSASDPLLRLDLEDQLDFARSTHSALDVRLRELNAFDPTLRVPGGEGVRPPVFTEEPPRLFAKQRDASNSPAWREGLNAVETDRWREPWPDGSQRTYREVKIYDPATGRTTIRQEILLRDGNWHLRGSEAAKRGLRMELVSRAYTEAAVEAATAGGTAKLVPFDAQNKSGHGFDEVVFRFTRDSKGRLQARVGLIEVKDYPGRYVPSADFTAIDDNMRQNLLSVERRMQQLGPDRLGMTPQEFTAALNALRERKLDVELRLGPDTKLGTGKNAATIPNLEADLQKRYPHGDVRVGHYDANGAWVDKRPVKLKGGLDEAALALERMQARMGEDRFTQLATTPSGAMTPSSILAADVIIKGEKSGAIPGPCAWAPDRSYLHDASGRPVLVEPLLPVSAKSFDAEAIAERLLGLLDEQRPPATSKRGVPVQVLVDTSALTPAQVTRLNNALKALARDRSRTIALGRLALVRAP